MTASTDIFQDKTDQEIIYRDRNETDRERRNNVSGRCRLCRTETESREHLLTDCTATIHLISNFNDLDTRNDIGQLWENFLLIERMKRNSYKNLATNYYFWRTYDKKEIDLIEERGGKLYGYEFKWNKHRVKKPKDWLETYKNASYEVITKKNYFEFVT